MISTTDLEKAQKVIFTFFNLHHLNYKFKCNKVEINHKVSRICYKSYTQNWYDADLEIEVEFNFVEYIKYPNPDTEGKTSIFINLIRYNKNEILDYLSLDDYFKRKEIYLKRLNDYQGETFEDKVKSFFHFLSDNMDEQLFKILSGEDWLYIPFDWGNYK